MKIALIPIDNRPVCYTLPLQISKINPDIELLVPNRDLLGGLLKKADTESIIAWIENISDIDAVVISLDTIAYGGLVSSRRGQETLDELKIKLEKFRDILKRKQCKIYAFSSVMRISNNNINEEEKEYWKDHGKKLFDYSFQLHKCEVFDDVELKGRLRELENEIPAEILDDYFSTRKRNFEINKIYVEWAKEGIFDALVFSKDDCAEYGLNVKEAQILKELSKDLSDKVFIKTGADEIPLSLLSRAVSDGQSIKIAPVFTQPEYISKISKYEDISVLESVISQVELAGCKISPMQEADIVLYVNNFKNQQGEIVMGVEEEGYRGNVDGFNKPYFIADILNANGADNCFVENLLKKGLDLEKFYGYAAWNTTGNTLGSSICAALMRLLSVNTDMDAFKRLQMVRFLDDWAYQANVRQEMKKLTEVPSERLLKSNMKQYEMLLDQKLLTSFYNIKYKFPWDRFFEIEVILD